MVLDKKHETNQDPVKIDLSEQLLSRQQFDTQIMLKEISEPQYWESFLDDSDINTFKTQAYVNPDGIAIRTNPITGRKELFIAGSRTSRDWMQNIAEGVDHSWDRVNAVMTTLGTAEKAKIVYDAEGWAKAKAFDPSGAIIMEESHNVFQSSTVARDSYAAYIDDIIREEDVEVVYGHSRGAAIMSGLKEDVVMIGLDGSTFISHDDADFINLVQEPVEGSFSFDKLISTGYKNNVQLSGRAFHDVTESKHSGLISSAKSKLKKRKIKPTKESKARVKKRKQTNQGRKKREKIKFLDKIMHRMSKSEQRAAFLKEVKKSKKNKGLSKEDVNDIVESLSEKYKVKPSQ